MAKYKCSSLKQQINVLQKLSTYRTLAPKTRQTLRDACNSLLSIKMVLSKGFAEDFTAHHEKHGAYNHHTTIGEDVVAYLEQRGLGL